MARYGMREVANVTFIDLQTNKPVMFLDTLKMSDVTIAAKSVDAVGGQGANRLLAWDYGRTVSVDVQDALLNPTSLSLLAGNAQQTGVQNVWKREVLTLVAGTGGTGTQVTLKEQSPVAGSVSVFLTDDGYDQTALTSDSNVTVTNGASEGDGATVAIAAAEADAVVGDQVIVYYQYPTDSTAWMTEITSDAFPGWYQVIGDTLVRNDLTGEDEPFQIILPKVKLTPGFKLTLQSDGNAPTVFDFKLEVYKPATDTKMVQMIKY